MEDLINQTMAILAAGAGAFTSEAAKGSAQNLISWLKEKLTSKTAQEKLELVEGGKQDKEVIFGLKALIEEKLENNQKLVEELKAKQIDGNGDEIYTKIKAKKLSQINKKYKFKFKGNKNVIIFGENNEVNY